MQFDFLFFWGVLKWIWQVANSFGNSKFRLFAVFFLRINEGNPLVTLLLLSWMLLVGGANSVVIPANCTALVRLKSRWYSIVPPGPTRSMTICGVLPVFCLN